MFVGEYSCFVFPGLVEFRKFRVAKFYSAFFCFSHSSAHSFRDKFPFLGCQNPVKMNLKVISIGKRSDSDLNIFHLGKATKCFNVSRQSIDFLNQQRTSMLLAALNCLFQHRSFLGCS